MNILLLSATYPHASHPFAGVFNERCAVALRPLCEELQVLAPRPYTPRLIAALHPRWRAYAEIPSHEVRAGVSISRPRYLQIPRVGAALWPDLGSYVFTRGPARAMHRRSPFDAILSFDLIQTGGLAWRLGRDLGIPAAGWALGSDVRVARTSPFAAVVRRAAANLRLIFYQSHELLSEAARILDVSPAELNPDRNIVLSQGIPDPPALSREETRHRVRKEWGIGEGQVLLLAVGRILRTKGVLELLDALAIAASQNSRVTAVMLGAMPGFDDREAVEQRLSEIPGLCGRVQILPACDPSAVWNYLCAADIFVFASHNEGMPNSLLEAMSMGVASIAFAIPPVKEIEAGTGALVLVPPRDSGRFAEEILRLASNPDERARIGAIGRTQVIERFLVRRSMAAAFARLSGMVETWVALPRAIEGACAPSGG